MEGLRAGSGRPGMGNSAASNGPVAQMARARMWRKACAASGAEQISERLKRKTVSNPFKNWGQAEVDLFNSRARQQAVRNCDVKKLDSECAASRHTLANQGDNPPDLFRESELHGKILEYCKSQGWLCFHGSTAHKTRRSVGEPDCICVAPGRVHFIECKRPGQKPTPAQSATIAWLKKLGASAWIVHSFEEFLDAIKQPETKETK